MSTRSGKRIHNSLHEDVDNVAMSTDNTLFCKTEKKTRSKRLKENMIDEENAGAFIKRKNYVAYPENNENDALMEPRGKPRKSRKNILKEHDINEVDCDGEVEDTVYKKKVRLTRQTKKFNDVQGIENTELSDAPNKKNKRNKVILAEKDSMEASNTTTNKKSKKEKQAITHSEDEVLENEVKIITKKTSKKKKKAKKTCNAKTVESIIPNKRNNTLNKSGMSVDSFHSAASSPVKELDTSTDKHSGKLSHIKSTSHDIFMSLDDEEPHHQSVRPTKQRKTSIKVDVTMLNGDISIESTKNVLHDNDVKRNETINKISKHKASIKPDGNSDAIIDTTYEETENISKLPGEEMAVELCNTTVEKLKSSIVSVKKRESHLPNVSEPIDVSFEASSSKSADIGEDKEIIVTSATGNSAKKQKRSRRLNHLDPETPPSVTKLSNKINKSLSETKKPILLDSTFDKQDEKLTQEVTINLDTTFDKSDDLLTSKTSLISSDNVQNVTYNKSNDISRISIISDESKTENIINTTPMLIESSLENTQLENTPTKTAPKEAVTTPLKREGTFTKDSPENTTSPLPKSTDTSSSSSATGKTPKKGSLYLTPDKGTPLGTAGSTPFPISKGSQKKSVLNVTRSIDKGTGRSSLVECAPRTTRVMFCSPVDFPLPTTESKRRIVKSSVKGSNKSFVFDNSTGSRPRPPGRKRSFTHDEDSTRAKRTRLADDLLQSAERLSRPRTNSATGKLGSSTPGNKPATPARPRTKLPNFAALHRKQFAKMESLDECQERKARRAKQLLVPTGSVAVLDRSSPKATDSPRKSKEFKTKKAEQEPKPGDTTLPSHTRFGFKMNIAGVANPFSIPPKEPTTVGKPKTKKPTGVNTRNTLPSFIGATAVRKDAAKQIIMREKSSTTLSNKRDMKRTQNRTIIKGVRTNRRFELQMQMRNLDG